MHRAAYAVPLMFLAIPVQGNAEAKQDRETDERYLRHFKTIIWPGYYRDQNTEGLRDFFASSFVNIGPDGSAVVKLEELAAVA